MPAERILPNDDELARLAKSMTHQQIADKISREKGVRVSRTAVSAALSRAGLTNRVRYADVIPWPRIKAEHNHHYALQMLRVKARIDAGLKVSKDLRERFESWSQRLHNDKAVVAYSPNTERGFFYVHKRPQDKGLVRKPD